MDLANLILQSLPEATTHCDGPSELGNYVLDACWRDRHVVVQFHAPDKFGVSATLEPAFGEGPHELYTAPEDAARRVIELLRPAGRGAAEDFASAASTGR